MYKRKFKEAKLELKSVLSDLEKALNLFYKGQNEIDYLTKAKGQDPLAKDIVEKLKLRDLDSILQGIDEYLQENE